MVEALLQADPKWNSLWEFIWGGALFKVVEACLLAALDHNRYGDWHVLHTTIENKASFEEVVALLRLSRYEASENNDIGDWHLRIALANNTSFEVMEALLRVDHSPASKKMGW